MGKTIDKTEEFVEYEPYRPIPHLNIPELEAYECVKPVGVDNYLIVACRPTSNNLIKCQHCGRYTCFKHGNAKDRLVHDISIGLTHIDLSVKVPRYKCNSCGKTFSYPFSSLLRNRQFTVRLYEQIKEEALNHTFAEVASRFGMTAPTIASVLEEYGSQLDQNHHPVAPRVLGIDEKHIVHKARGVIVDVERGILLEMTEDNKAATMKQAIENLIDYGENIKIVTMDMSAGYVSLVEECLPNAIIVIDKFHVVQNIYRKIEKTRKIVFAYLKQEVSRIADGDERERKEKLLARMGHNAYLFKYGAKRLATKPSSISLMAELCEEFPIINMLRLLKDGAEKIYEATTRREAEEYFDAWEALVPPIDEYFEEIRTLQRSMNRWKKYIFNYFDTEARYTNAATEGLNSLIGHINDEGRGYSFKTLRAKVLYHKSAIDRPRYTIRRSTVPSFGYSTGWNPGGYTTTVEEKVLVSGGGTVIDTIVLAFAEHRII